jgi:fatty-acyl-CoA synthase
LVQVYGPNTICETQDEWATLSPAELAQRNAQQGVRFVTTENVIVANTRYAHEPSDGDSGINVSDDPNVIITPVPRDGKALGKSSGF